jgi:plasmid stabilization system protein ParE
VNELVFLLSAEVDIQAAYEFYEAFQPGRGGVFLRHLDLAFGQLRTFPESAPLFRTPYRRLLIRGFPYGVFYSLAGRRVIVAAVMDLRQDPEWIGNRLRESPEQAAK